MLMGSGILCDLSPPSLGSVMGLFYVPMAICAIPIMLLYFKIEIYIRFITLCDISTMI